MSNSAREGSLLSKVALLWIPGATLTYHAPVIPG
jgi:hypothetical protein